VNTGRNFRAQRGYGSCLAGALLLSLSNADPAFAGYWRVEQELVFGGGYDSNLRFRIDDLQETWRGRLKAGLAVHRVTERTTATVAADGRLLRHADTGFADSEDFTLEARGSWSSQRWSLGLGTVLDRSNTLTTSLVDSVFEDLGVQRERRSVTPRVTWQRSETTAWRLSGGYEDVEYSDAGSLVDFDYRSLSLAREAAIGENTTWSLSIDVGDYEARDIRLKSRNLGARAGLEHDLSETLSLRGSIGRNRNDSERVFRFLVFDFLRQDRSEGWTLDASLRKRWEHAKLNLSVEQSVQPTGQGALVERAAIVLDLEYRLSERFAIGVGGRATELRTTSELAELDDDRRYRRLGLRFTYRPAERCTVEIEGRHDTQAVDRRNDAAHRNSAFLTITWRKDWHE